MKKNHAIISIAILSCITVASLIGVIVMATRPSVNWHAPMMSISLSSHTIDTWSETPLTVNANGSVVNVNQSLVESNAIRATVNLSYKGEGTHYVQMNTTDQAFDGHGSSATIGNRPQVSNDDVLILWRNHDTNQWWCIRRARLWGQNTLGSPHHQSTVNNANMFSFRLNKNTISEFETIEFFIVVNAENTAANTTHNDRFGYIITFFMDTPNQAGHFHGVEVLASTTTTILVNE